MRELIPVRTLLLKILERVELTVIKESLVLSTVFEDNQSCLSCVNVPKMSTRNKCHAIKCHFFRSFIGRDKGIIATCIPTALQRAATLAKGLPKNQFVVIRKLLMGWQSRSSLSLRNVPLACSSVCLVWQISHRCVMEGCGWCCCFTLHPLWTDNHVDVGAWQLCSEDTVGGCQQQGFAFAVPRAPTKEHHQMTVVFRVSSTGTAHSLLPSTGQTPSKFIRTNSGTQF